MSADGSAVAGGLYEPYAKQQTPWSPVAASLDSPQDFASSSQSLALSLDHRMPG